MKNSPEVKVSWNWVICFHFKLSLIILQAPLSSVDLVSCVIFVEMDQENQTEPVNSDNSTAGITLILQTAFIVSQISSYECRFLLTLICFCVLPNVTGWQLLRSPTFLSLYVFIII